MVYVTPAEYSMLGYDAIDDAHIMKHLREASRQVDAMTFNRIVATGFDKLTEFQQGIIKTVVCEQADFLFENSDAIHSVLSSYSINGVSMKFGDGMNIIYEGGLPIERTTYNLLKQTGLCCRLVG